MLFGIVLVALLGASDALYFHVTEGKQRCFIEEVPAETLVVGSYNSPDVADDPDATEGVVRGTNFSTKRMESIWTSAAFEETCNARDRRYGFRLWGAQSIRVVVTDPRGVATLQKNVEKEGRFAFTSHHGGEHTVCLSTTKSRWFGAPRQFRFELRLDVGETAIDYSEVAQKEHLTTLELDVRRLNDKLLDILKEQQYQKEREIAFRDTSESNNSRVMWWSIFQMVVMVSSSVLQLWYLKTFLRREKVK